MSFLKRWKNRITNRLAVHHYFDSGIRALHRNLKTLAIVDVSAYPKLIETFNHIKIDSPKRYADRIALYENMVARVQIHNDEVQLINRVVETFDYDKILNNPHIFDAEALAQVVDAVKKIKTYKKFDDSYVTFIERVEDIAKHYNDLVKEFDLLAQYNALAEIDPELGYIDSSTKKERIAGRESIRKKADTFEKRFYSWPDDTVVIDNIKSHNEAFIKANLYLPLFDAINGRSLDEEQRRSVLTDEAATLVVAGAGSGKTLTICGKVAYLLKVKNIDPGDILLLSYSRKSAEDLQAKINGIDPRLEAKTFHELGLEILSETQKKKFMVEDQFKAIIESYFRDELVHRPKMMQEILMYYGLYLSPNEHAEKYHDEGELYAALKKTDFQTLKSQLLSYTNDFTQRETIKKEHVKSFEEMALANWYFIHGVKYRYEAPYEIDVSTLDRRQYSPDFYLPDYHIYHEHYGIDRSGKAEQFGGPEAERYVEDMQWKRQLHLLNRTTCIETYSYEFEEGTVFDELERELKNQGVEFHPLSEKETYAALESIYQKRAFKSFITLIRTFLSLYKSNYQDEEGFEELKKRHYPNQYEKQRAAYFLDIAKDVYDFYMDHLRKEGKIDFDDMILQSTNDLMRTDRFRFRYIIVDEFQDISMSRMQFLQALIAHGKAKLFAVGDDWQAIYRFSGCDLDIFFHFATYFGDCAVTKITTTHRNAQELLDIVGPFIQANPLQLKKTMHSNIHLEHPIQVMYYRNHKYDAFLTVLDRIAKLSPEADVLILGRNNRDLEGIVLDKRIHINPKKEDDAKLTLQALDFPTLKLSFSTVHGSKGLEADYVILINAEDSLLGFPNKIEDDVLLNLVLNHGDTYEFAEERRLWYVALTRARKNTYILVDRDEPSIFFQEIEDKCLVLNPTEIPAEADEEKILCPRCKSGKLVLRTSKSDGHQFYACSNYPYCDYTIHDIQAVKRNLRCPRCGDFLVQRKGLNGYFYGCHNYPRCHYIYRKKRK